MLTSTNPNSIFITNYYQTWNRIILNGSLLLLSLQFFLEQPKKIIQAAVSYADNLDKTPQWLNSFKVNKIIRKLWRSTAVCFPLFSHLDSTAHHLVSVSSCLCLFDLKTRRSQQLAACAILCTRETLTSCRRRSSWGNLTSNIHISSLSKQAEGAFREGSLLFFSPHSSCF